LIFPQYFEFISCSLSGYSNFIPVFLKTYFVFILSLVSEMGVTPVLFEQTVHKDYKDGLRDISIVAMKKYNVTSAADKSY